MKLQKRLSAVLSFECEPVSSIIFCVFIVIGAAVKLEAILDFADALIFVMAIPNLIGLYILAPEVKRDLATYFAELDADKVPPR